jgi:hypothetical protein
MVLLMAALPLGLVLQRFSHLQGAPLNQHFQKARSVARGTGFILSGWLRVGRDVLKSWPLGDLPAPANG